MNASFPPTRDATEALLRAALGAANADEVQVFLGAGRLGVLDVRADRAPENRTESWGMLEVRARRGGAMGVARTAELGLNGAKEAAKRASELARSAPVKRALRPLPDPVPRAESREFDPSILAMPPAGRVALLLPLLLEARRHGIEVDARLWARAGSLGPGAQTGLLAAANSRGLLHVHRTTRVRLAARLRGPVCEASLDTEHWLLRELDPLYGFAWAAARARLNAPRKDAPPRGDYAVVLEPNAVADFVEALAPHFSAEAVARGQSFLRGRQGRPIARANISLRDDFAHPLHAAPPFDGDGQPRTAVPLIERGVARSLTYSREQAWRENATPTGHAPVWPVGGDARPRHLVLEGEDRSVDELIASVERGILIMGTAGHRVVDPTRATCAGTTRAGTFWIERGRVTAALPPLRYEKSAFDLLAQTTRLSRTEKAGRVVAPAILSQIRILGGAS